MYTRFNLNVRTLELAALVLILMLTPGLAGCTPSTSGKHVVAAAGLLQSDQPRQTPISLEAAQVDALVASNTAFALDLYRTLFTRDDNLFYSPHSLSTALAMMYLGARGDTETQMAEALHYTLPQSQLHTAFNALDQALTSHSDAAFQLHLVNAVWGQAGEKFLSAYIDALAQNYGTGLHIVDFQQADQARRSINQWVAEQTEEKIPELLPTGALDAETALVLTNAIYFKAAWEHTFSEDLTHESAFQLLNGQEVQIPMMQQATSLGYAEKAGTRAVELPYAGGAFSMVLLLPEAGTFERFSQDLDTDTLNALLVDLSPAYVRLTMPKFHFDTALEMKQALMALGMVDAFGDADFSGIDGTRELFIDEVYHQAFVHVDEAGTEAAAATAVVAGRKSARIDQVLTLDRPFLFLIRDLDTGTILFLGHVVNPGM